MLFYRCAEGSVGLPGGVHPFLASGAIPVLHRPVDQMCRPDILHHLRLFSGRTADDGTIHEEHPQNLEDHSVEFCLLCHRHVAALAAYPTV